MTNIKYIYNILKKENHNTDSLLTLIKESNISFSDKVTVKKNLAEFLLNEISEEFLEKLHNDNILKHINGKIIVQLLKPENIHRLPLLNKIGIKTSEYDYTKILMENTEQKKAVFELIKSNILSLNLLLLSYNINKFNSFFGSLENLKLIEECSYNLKPQDFLGLYYTITKEESEKILDYFSNKNIFNQTFDFNIKIKSHIYEQSKNQYMKINTNLTGALLFLNNKNNFLDILEKKYPPIYSKEILQVNIENFPKLNDYIYKKPNQIFNHKENITSLNLLLSNIVEDNQSYVNINKYFKQVTHNEQKAIVLKNTFLTNKTVAHFIFNKKFYFKDMLDYYNKDLYINNKMELQNSIIDIIKSYPKVFNSIELIKKNPIIHENVKLMNLLYTPEVIHHPDFPKHIINSKIYFIHYIDNIIKSEINIKDKLYLSLFYINSIDTNSNNTTQKIESTHQLIEYFNKELSQDGLKIINDLLLNNGPEKWKNVELTAEFIHKLKSNIKSDNNINHSRKKRF